MPTYPTPVYPAVLSPSPDTVFDQVWAWVASLFMVDITNANDPLQSRILKGNQNFIATPASGDYAIIQPLVSEALNQNIRDYTPNVDPNNPAGTVSNELHTKQSWQVDCYGPDAATWAATIAGAWRTMWTLDNWPDGTPFAITPLYADQPQLLTIINGEGQFESRYLVKLYGQVNQTVTLPQAFFTQATIDAIPVDVVPLS